MKNIRKLILRFKEYPTKNDSLFITAMYKVYIIIGTGETYLYQKVWEICSTEIHGFKIFMEPK